MVRLNINAVLSFVSLISDVERCTMHLTRKGKMLYLVRNRLIENAKSPSSISNVHANRQPSTRYTNRHHQHSKS